MATRPLLAELAQAYTAATAVPVGFESVGGVEAARRVQTGEAFDLVVLAGDAIDGPIASGHLLADSRRALADSAAALAVPAGAPRPDIGSETALRNTLLAARAIGYSTGPSGTALLRLFERWSLTEVLSARLVQARPGVSVGSLIAAGEVDIGIQQLSELMQLDGISVLGGLPRGLEIVTSFAGAIGARSTQADSARALLDFLTTPDTAAVKRRHGMDAPRQTI
nr:substrate-binding domain-containing protein [Roseateles toxinivorans]